MVLYNANSSLQHSIALALLGYQVHTPTVLRGNLRADKMLQVQEVMPHAHGDLKLDDLQTADSRNREYRERPGRSRYEVLSMSAGQGADESGYTTTVRESAISPWQSVR